MYGTLWHIQRHLQNRLWRIGSKTAWLCVLVLTCALSYPGPVNAEPGVPGGLTRGAVAHSARHQLSYPAATIQVAQNAPADADYDSGVLMVQFDAPYRVRLRGGTLIDLNARAEDSELARLQQFGTWARAYSVDEAFIDDTRRQAEAIRGEPMPDLNNYYYVYPPNTINWSEEWADLRAALRASSLVSFADRIPVAYPTQSVPDYQDLVPGEWYQRYLDPAPDGIDARWAWMGAGGRGQNVQICDIEYGYNPTHVDIPQVNVLGTSYTGKFQEHGTAVLGILGGPDNGFGLTGIVSEADYYFAYVGPDNFIQELHETRIHDAIFRCMEALDPGDIILVEQQVAGPNRPANPSANDQRGLVAVDWYKPYYDAAKIAATMMIVVESAGNGSEWLDLPAYQTESVHDPFVLANRSGAIIVGAGESPYAEEFDESVLARSAKEFSNHGSIVRLQGWGAQIVAPGYGLLYPGADEDNDIDSSLRNEYFTLFSGTSGAAPIVVGAAAAVQSIHKEVFNQPIFAAEMEELLRDTGTSQEGGEFIGPLPNIRAAVEDIFAENNVGLSPNPPVVDPPGGLHNMPLEISIDYGNAGQNQSNSVVRYTLNGTEPDFEESFLFVPDQGDTLYLNYGVTLKAKTFQYDETTQRWFPSETVTHEYVSTTPKVNAPVVGLPGPGPEFTAPLTVTLTTSTPGATIRYRTDGRSPSFFYPGTLYTGPFTLSPGEYTITARGYKDGYYKSDATYSDDLLVLTSILPPPVVSPSGGAYNGSVEVAMSHVMPQAEIRYTTDGSNVQPTSTLYSEPFELEQDATIQARAYRDGYAPSLQTLPAVFEITEQLPPPKFTPAGGTYAGPITVEIVKPIGATEVRYTTNGALPGRESPLYTGPFTLGIGEHTVRARAFSTIRVTSDIATEDYTLYDPNPAQVAPPIFDPAGGNHTEVVTITMQSNTEGATIRYTFSPLEPEEQWLTYSEPLVLGPSEDVYVIRAKAYKTGMSDSDFTQASYNVFEPVGTVETPWITPGPGGYANPIEVTVNLTRTPPFVVPMIYHTTDGSTPVVPPNTAGETPPHSFTLAKATLVRAIGAQLGHYNSEEVSAAYFFYCAVPQLTPGGTYTDTVSVSMSTATESATIYYTTDGSTPTQQSTEYSAPIELGLGETAVKARCYRNNFDPSAVAQHIYNVQVAPPPPTLSQEPGDVVVPPGAPVALQAALDSAIPETAQYQWQRNGNPIGGENEPILEIPATQAAQAGEYHLVVTTEGGQVTSQAASVSLEDAAITGLQATSNSPTVVGQPTEFFATVTAGTGISYTWSFGDGDMGSGDAPTHTYGAIGSYTATVTATNDVAQLTAQTTVVVTDSVTAITGLAADSSAPGTLDTPVVFTATVTGGTGITYTWNFGDGNQGTGPRPSHTYTDTGTYTATVTAENASGMEQATTLVTVSQASRAISGLAAANNSPTQLDSPTSFNATIDEGTAVSFTWDFGDGNVGTGPSPSHTYAAAGTYTAEVIAANDVNNVMATTVVTVVDGNLPINNVTVSASTPTELGEATTFSADSDGTGVAYTWDFGDGSTGTGANPTHVYTQTGTYDVQVTAQNDKGQRAANTQVVVQVTPRAIQELELVPPANLRAGTVQTFQANIGAGSNVTYSWDFGDGNTGTGAVVNHTYAQPGSYLVLLTASNDVSGDVIVSRQVTVADTSGQADADVFLPTIQR